MKTHKTNKISLKKLTIARISLGAMDSIKGGSSVPSIETEPLPTVRQFGGPCYHRP